MKTIHWGILGAGNIAHKFAADLAMVDGTALHGIASRNQSKANEFATRHKMKVAYGNYDDLVKDPAIDAIYIATPHSFHKTHALLCLKHFKPVLCEKPFAMNLEEVETMIHVSKTNNTLLMEAMWTLFLPHYQKALQLLRDKHFGNILKLEADFGFHFPFQENSRAFKKTLGGGSLLDIGIYPVFAALSNMGSPKTIDAKAEFYANGVDSNCNVIFGYKQSKAVLSSTFLKETKTEAIFYCENGIIKINGRFHQPSSLTLIDKQGNKELLTFERKTLGYSYEIAHFNQLIRDKKSESDFMTFNKSLELISTLDAIRNRIGLDYK